MNITSSNLQALFTDINVAFKSAMLSTPQELTPKVAQTMTSKSRDSRYPVLQTLMAGMRVWNGPREINNIVVDSIVITNAKFENTLSIKREDVEDDQYDAYADMAAPLLGRNAKLLPDLQVASVLNSNPTCFDGKTLFNQNHYVNAQSQTGAQSNDLGTSKPLNGTNLALAQAALRNLQAADGVSFGSYGNVIVVPPSLEYTATTLANSTFYPEIKNGVSAAFGAQANPWKGAFEVVVSPFLTDSGDPTTAVWYLLDCQSTVRPVIWQERIPAQLVQLVDPSNPIVFQLDEFQMGTRFRGAASPAFWFKGVRANHTAST